MILMYHKIHPDNPTMWWVTVNNFYRQMAEIKSRKVVYLQDYNVNDPNQVVITFDGVYKNILEYALPILKHFKYPFELFLTSNYIGLDNEFDAVEPNAPFANTQELLVLVKGGGRLQWHTQSHPNLKNIKDIALIDKELTVPQELIDLDCNGFNWFAYPYGEFNDVVLTEVKKRFKGAVSCIQGNDTEQYILNRVTVTNETQLRENSIACIIASYNYGDYLVEAVESVLRQTILPNEILISDDCSDDDTQLIAEGYMKKYPDLIRYNRNKKNLGIIDHFNKAISLTKSEYIFFLGADNRILSNYIEECAGVLDKKSVIGIAYTDYAFFGTRAKLAYEAIYDEWKGEIRQNTYYQVNFPAYKTNEELMEGMKRNSFIHGSSMYRRKAFNSIGGYLKSNSAEDYILFKRMIYNGWIAKKASKTNLEYRQHSFAQINNVVSLHNTLNFYRQFYLDKSNYEKSKIHKIANKVYRIMNTPKKKLIKRFVKKIIKKIKFW